MTTARTLNHWGAYELLVDDGRIVEARGVTTDPDPSPIGRLVVGGGGPRVEQPLVRASWLEHGVFSRPERRGDESLIGVGWDVALDLVAEALDRTINETGNASVFGGSYGWGNAGRFHHPQSQLKRFLNCLGGYVGSIGTYSHGAAEVVAPAVTGLGIAEFLRIAPTADELVERTEVFVSLGGFPAANTQIASGGDAEHWYRPALLAAAERGCRFVSIGPNRSAFDEAVGAEWLPLRPGTDAALLLGWLGELIRTGRWDRTAVARWCSDPSALIAHVDGTDDDVVRDADWAAGVCDLEVAAIRRVLDLLVERRSLLNTTWSTQRVLDGEHVVWSLLALGAFLGQLDEVGAGIAFGYGSMSSVGQPRQTTRLVPMPQGVNGVDRSIPVSRLTELLTSPGGQYTFAGATHWYPEVELIYWCGGNPFHHHQSLLALEDVWKRPRAVIVNEPYMTATAARADVVLASSVSWERADIGGSSTGRYLVRTEAATEPAGAALDDHEIFRRLADRLDVEDDFTEGRSPAEWQRWLYDEIASRDGSLPDWDRFVQFGIVERGAVADRSQWRSFLADPVGSPLSTPSGRVQLSLPTAPGVPQMPVWTARAAPTTERATFALVTPMPARRLHAHLGGDEVGPVEVHINSDDASGANLRDGDPVTVFNDRGAFDGVVRSTDRVRRGVLVVENGAWLDVVIRDGRRLCARGNVNVLTSDEATSGWGQACAAHTCRVAVVPRAGSPQPSVRSPGIPSR